MSIFNALLSPEARARIEQDRREVLRLYGLGNAWLAAVLLAAAREAQSAAPQLAPGECTYNARLIWGIVPEVARRLGVVRLTTNEIDWESRELSDYELRVRAVLVSFEPAARTAWHTHPLGQTLYIVSGCGLVQSWAGEARFVHPGDSVWIPPGEKHWHGACADEGMSHIAIQEALDETAAEWLEKVTDAQYETASASAG